MFFLRINGRKILITAIKKFCHIFTMQSLVFFLENESQTYSQKTLVFNKFTYRIYENIDVKFCFIIF